MSKEEQIQARIAALRNELEAAAMPSSSGGTSTVEQLEADLRRRQESYIRRERAFEEQIQNLQDEVSRLKAGRSSWMDSDERVRNIREMHSQLMKNVSQVKDSTARVLKDQEKDLLRAFRARLFDIQNELEVEKSKADVGASAWIEKNRQLERGLDWAKEMADRLERVNQSLQAENQKLKAQYKTQETDREFLIRQLVTVKKDNVQLRQELEAKDDELARQQEEIEQLVTFKKASMTRSTTVQSVSGVGGTPIAGSRSVGTLPSVDGASAMHSGINRVSSPSHGGGFVSESEARYKEIIKRLKKLLDTERNNLKKARQAYSADVKSRTELETLLRQCVEDVRQRIAEERKGNRRASSSTSSTRSVAHLPRQDSGDVGAPFEAREFEDSDRDKVLELLLSQERVVRMLYKRTFPSSKAIPTSYMDLPAAGSLKPNAAALDSRSSAAVDPVAQRPDLESSVASRLAPSDETAPETITATPLA